MAEAEVATAREAEAKADVMMVTAVALRVDNSSVTLLGRAVLEDPMSIPALGPFFSDDIAGFLAEYGYTANPAGLVGQYSGDFTFERDSWAWLDVNAIAVRQGDIVPDRPIRISFRLEYNGAFAQWKLLSVEELPAGVASKALDRERDFPKVSPWPPGGIK
jgi:hypothetical protein